ncbi:hypothetical protein D3C74_444630 [compost metagenome]
MSSQIKEFHNFSAVTAKFEEDTRKKFFSEIEKAIDSLGGQITIYDTIDLQLAKKL